MTVPRLCMRCPEGDREYRVSDNRVDIAVIPKHLFVPGWIGLGELGRNRMVLETMLDGTRPSVTGSKGNSRTVHPPRCKDFSLSPSTPRSSSSFWHGDRLLAKLEERVVRRNPSSMRAVLNRQTLTYCRWLSIKGSCWYQGSKTGGGLRDGYTYRH